MNCVLDYKKNLIHDAIEELNWSNMAFSSILQNSLAKRLKIFVPKCKIQTPTYSFITFNTFLKNKTAWIFNYNTWIYSREEQRMSKMFAFRSKRLNLQTLSAHWGLVWPQITKIITESYSSDQKKKKKWLVTPLQIC